MKILAHVHTLNDEDVIDACLAALLAQTRPVDGVLIVDNGSSDRTLERSLPPHARVIRNAENLGTSGAVRTGLAYGMDHGFDWVWVFDADSAPHPDALEKLVALWETLSSDERERVWRLSSLPLEHPEKSVTSPFSLRLARFDGSREPKPRHGVVFDARGYHRVEPEPGVLCYACDGTIWSGCLFRLDAVRRVGLPPADYVLDFGEYEYGWRGKRCGQQGLMHTGSLVDHNIRGEASFTFSPYRFGPLHIQLLEIPPIRCYYVVRNPLHFWLHQFEPRSLRAAAPRVYKMLMLTLNFLVRPWSHRAELRACLRGLWDGVRGQMDRRF